jgi:hypothetical protein
MKAYAAGRAGPDIHAPSAWSRAPGRWIPRAWKAGLVYLAATAAVFGTGSEIKRSGLVAETNDTRAAPPVLLGIGAGMPARLDQRRPAALHTSARSPAPARFASAPLVVCRRNGAVGRALS